MRFSGQGFEQFAKESGCRAAEGCVTVVSGSFDDLMVAVLVMVMRMIRRVGYLMY